MKVNVKLSNLTKALSVVSRMAGNASALPVLANVLISTDKNRLKLSSTNLEMGANYWIGAKVVSPGAVTAPGRLLADFINNLQDENIELEVEKANLKVTTPHHHTTLNGIEVEEFPSIPEIKASAALTIEAPELKKAINQVAVVASHDDARPVLSGVYIYNEGKTLYLVSTDSYRLAEKSLILPGAPKGKISVIVPARTMQELVRVLDESVETIEMAVEESQVLFRFGDGEIISRQIDGQFPNYRELIPQKSNTTVEIGVDQFANLAKIAGLFSQTNAGSVLIEADNGAQKLKLSSVASQVGQNVSEAEVKVDGADSQVTLNSRYISEALSTIDSDKINFSITGKINPCLIKPTDAKDFLHIIMPLRS